MSPSGTLLVSFSIKEGTNKLNGSLTKSSLLLPFLRFLYNQKKCSSESEKIISQIVGISEVCDQSRNRVSKNNNIETNSLLLQYEILEKLVTSIGIQSR